MFCEVDVLSKNELITAEAFKPPPRSSVAVNAILLVDQPLTAPVALELTEAVPTDCFAFE